MQLKLLRVELNMLSGEIIYIGRTYIASKGAGEDADSLSASFCCGGTFNTTALYY